MDTMDPSSSTVVSSAALIIPTAVENLIGFEEAYLVGQETVKFVAQFTLRKSQVGVQSDLE